MKETLKKYQHLIRLEAVMAVIFFFFCLISAFACNVSIWDGMKFFLFQLVYVFLPGFLTVSVLKPNLSTNVEWFGMSYFCGYIFDLFLYLLIVPLHVDRLIGVIPLNCIFTAAMAVIPAAVIKKDSREICCERDRAGEIICVLFLLANLGYALFSYSGKNMIPYVLSESDFESDILYWIGNTIELTKEFPPLNFRNYPQPYNYHYFSSMQLALATVVTGIRPMVTGIVFHSIQAVVLMVFGMYFLFTRFSKRKALVALVMAIAFFSTGMEEQTFILYNLKLHIVPFGFDYAFGCFMWGLYLLWLFCKTGKPKPKLILMLLISVVALTGIKGPFGIAALMICGILCICKLFRGEAKAAFLTGLPVLAAFLVTYFLITNVSGYINTGMSDYLQHAGQGNENNQLQNSLYGMRYTALLTSHYPVPVKAAAVPLFLALFMIAENPVIAALEFTALIRAFLKKALWDPFHLSLLITIILLNIITLNYHILGSSEMYFSLVSLPLGLTLFLYHTGEGDKAETAYLGACFIIGLTCLFMNTAFHEMTYSLKRGLRSVILHEYKLNPNAATYANHITGSQVAGLEYIRELPGDLVITNGNERVMGCFSEKYVIPDEGLKKLFSETEEEDQNGELKEAVDYGIDYVIVDRIKLPDYELKDEQAELIFENADIGIYDLRKSE